MSNESRKLTAEKTVRAVLSKKNKYYISKHRYYELRHFCLQYKEWKKELRDISDPSVKRYLEANIKLIEEAVYLSGSDLTKWLLTAITEDRSYTYLSGVLDIPCCRDVYYEMYHKFFYTLSMLKIKICE